MAEDDRLAGAFAATVAADHAHGSYLAKGATAVLFLHGLHLQEQIKLVI